MRERLRALPLCKLNAGFYTTLDGKYAFVRSPKPGTIWTYEWVVLDNDYTSRSDDKAQPLPLGLMEQTLFSSLSEAAWMLRRHGDQHWREDNGYRGDDT